MSTNTNDVALELRTTAEQLLAQMRQQGFDGAQVSVRRSRRQELNVAHNEPSLLRSTEATQVQLTGLLDGRRADAEGSELDADSLRALVQGLWASVASAPQDSANAVSAGQRARVRRGPQRSDAAVLADAVHEMLDWRAREVPSVMLEEALAGHTQTSSCTLTSGGSELEAEVGDYDAVVFGMAREGTASSSFNYAGGHCERLAGEPLMPRFGMGDMLRAMTRSVHTRPIGEPFVGAVVLTPPAMAGLLGWLLGQLGDQALIDGSSVYRGSVGQRAASPLLTLASRFDAPGVPPFAADAFALAPVTLLDRGTLKCLTPSLYGSRKTALPHVPVCAEGWDLAAGTTPLAQLIAGVPRGALVDRLSMGRPAANGDFSGVIKNSFAIRDGEVGQALSETMISGNVAQMLRDVSALSAERIDSGDWVVPWVRVEALHFS
ncbi:MAG: metallopeptidase TldD-related protein [Burkholderiaceae bacterium]